MGLFDRIREAASGFVYDEQAARGTPAASAGDGPSAAGATTAEASGVGSSTAPELGDRDAFLRELERLRGVGRPATATVLEAADTGVRSGELAWCRIALQVQSAEHGYYRAEVVQPLTMTAAAGVRPGASRALLVDPADRNRMVFTA